MISVSVFFKINTFPKVLCLDELNQSNVNGDTTKFLHNVYKRRRNRALGKVCRV